MYKLFVALLFMCWTIPAFSQDDDNAPMAKVKMTTSPAYENDKSRTMIRNMMRDRMGNIYIVKTQYKVFGKSKLLVEKYSPELKQKFSKELVIKGTEGKDMDYLAAYNIGNEPYVLSSFYNKGKEKRYLFISKVEDSGIIGKPKKISEVDTDDKDEGYFTMHFSKDSSRFLVVNHQSTKRKEKVKFSFTVLDNTLAQVWEANVTMPFETRDVYLSDFEVDNQNRVYVLATVDNDDKKSKSDADVFQEIFMYADGTKAPKRYNLELKGKLITGLHLHEDKNGDLLAVGTYASTEQRKMFFNRDRTSPQGTLFVKINQETGTIGTKTIAQFKPKTFDFFRVKDSKVKDGKGVEHLRLENSWVGDDNSVNLDLEQNYVIVTSNTNSRGMVTNTNYHYYSDMAMLIKFGADGKIINEVIIPKKMTSTNDQTGLGHVLTHIGSEAYYVYNDSPKNWGKQFEDENDVSTGVSPESGGLSFKKKPQVVLCTVDAEGKKKYARLFNFKEDDVFLNTEASLKYSERSFVVVASYYKDFKLIKIEF